MNNKNPVFVFTGTALVLLAILGGRPGSPAEPGQPKAYHPSSLKDLSNEELMAYMGRGASRVAEEWAERNQVNVPERFWDSSPREAALALLAATQTPEGKERYAVALGKPPAAPPNEGTLIFSDFSDRSYDDVRTHYFLSFSPRSSFFAYAVTLSPGEVGYDDTQAGSAYDLRSREVPYGEARHFAQVIWWLRLAETRKAKEVSPRFGMSFSGFSSADGRGHLTLLPGDGGKGLTESGILHAMAGGMWGGDYDRETFLNVAGFAIEEILPERLFNEGPEVRFERMVPLLGISRQSGDYAPDELARLKGEILLFLKRYSPEGRNISHWHVLAAVRAAGDIVLAEATPLLKGIQNSLPRPAPAEKGGGRSLAEIAKEIQKLMTAEAADESEEKIDKLMEELERVEGRAMSGQAIERELKAAAAAALRKIEAGDDIATLKKWAESRDPESAWAASRLRKVSTGAAVESFAARLELARPQDRPEILQAIFRADPKKAVEAAARVPADDVSELGTTAAWVLGKAGLLSGDGNRIASLIEVVLDKTADWEQRSLAIEVLVPRDDPGRFPDEAIDDALIAVVEHGPSEGLMPDFTLPRAARALAWRKRVDKLESLIALFEPGDKKGAKSKPGSLEGLQVLMQSTMHQDNFLSAVTYLARLSKEPGLRRLAQILAPHFQRTNLQITEILWSAWAADLREFKDEIERIATGSPAEEEGPRASSSGGPVTEVNERYHLARKIAALWNEKDRLTRGKLLLALGYSQTYEFVESEALERREQMEAALATLAGEATPAELEALRRFIIWAEDSVVKKEKTPVYRERMKAFSRLAEGILIK